MPSDHTATPRLRVGGVTSRLITLVMLPVTVTCVLAGSFVYSHWSGASKAGAIDRGVADLSYLVELRDSLHTQQSVEAFNVRFEQLGVTQADATTFIGVDWAAQIEPARTEGDQAIAALGQKSPIDPEALRVLYAKIDTALIGPTEAAQHLDDFSATVGRALADGLNGLENDARAAPELVTALESLRAASGLENIATPRVVDLSAVWFPSPTDTAQTTAAALARLGADSADYRSATNRLRDLGVPTVVAELTLLEADPRVNAFDVALTETLAGQPLTAAGATLDTDKVAAVFRGHIVLDSLLDDLVATATTSVREDARREAATQRFDFVLWTAGAAGVALASIAIALRLSHSISRPLKDLAAYAHAVNEGQLEAQPAHGRNKGPRETRVALSVFTDLVINLQLLDAKANALAHLEFDSPALTKPLPGRLGQSLESSVALLSGSIVERDQLQIRLAHQATHDSLTGIFNRPAAITGIQAALDRATRTGATTAVLFVDLNDFKAVNDSHGHEVGDEVLRQIASRMTVGLRSGDFAARLGGDEFVVVAEAIAGVADATDMARRIVDIIVQPIEVGALRISIGAAVGVALTLDGPEDPLRLLARADAAMYRAKRHDRSAIEIFDANLQRQMVEREDVETALTAVLAATGDSQLQLHYQPVLDATTGAMVGAEALIRWDRPGHGLLPPDAFIPIAEATALIIDIDCWVLAAAARQLVAWSSVAELADVPVAVNISGRHLLSRRLPGHIRAVLAETGIDPHLLIIEITETVLLTDLVAAAAELDQVRAIGLKVAIDDFGTGYTSLAHLQQLPIDTIKIDRSFISQLDRKRGSSLVRMVTDLGHAIDITVIAEGVETDQEMTSLQAIGADFLQGYLLSRPLEPDAFETWARDHVSTRWQPTPAG